MQVRYDEGVAIHIDLEPCAVTCEGGSEASAEEHIGQPLSPAKIHIPGADAVAKAEGDTDGRVSASAWRTGVVEEPGMCGSSLHGNREIPRPASRKEAIWSASGRRGAIADDKRTREVRLRHSN